MLPPKSDPALLLDSPEYQAFQRFARLIAQKKELQAKLQELEPQLRTLEPILLGYLGENGYGKVQVEGFTMSPKREPWVYPLQGVDRESVCEALKLSGLERYVYQMYSTRSLTAYVRELEAHHNLLAGVDPGALKKLLPEALANVLEVRPGFRLRVLDRRKKKGLEHANPEEEESRDWDDDDE